MSNPTGITLDQAIMALAEMTAANSETLNKLAVISEMNQKALVDHPVFKHDPTNVEITGQHAHNYESIAFDNEGFFSQCELDSAIMNMTLQPRETLLNYIPAVANHYTEQKHGMLTGLETTVAGTRPVNVCDPGQVVSASYDFCKFGGPWSRYDLSSNTFEIDQLIREACEHHNFDRFFFIGDVRGITAPPNRRLDPFNDRDLINEGAIMRVMAEMARVFQFHLAKMLWDGDPINNSAGTPPGYAEFIGLTHYIDDDIPNSTVMSPWLESSTGDLTDCEALNADVKVFDDCIGAVNVDGYNLWMLLQEMEHTLYSRADAMSLLPVDWRIVMTSLHFYELAKVLPCEIASDGCIHMGPFQTDAPKTGNIDMSQMVTERELMKRQRFISINGRNYQVLFDDLMPSTVGGQNLTELTAGIYFIPFSVAGRRVLWLEYMDYSRIARALSGIPSAQRAAAGWIDNAKYHAIIEWIRRCFVIDVKTENRLKFIATALSGVITGVRACTIQRKPQHQFSEDRALID